MPFMNRALSKKIMTRARLRKIFLKDRYEENKTKYSKKKKKKKISESKTFWKTIKPFLSDKITSMDDENTAEVSKAFFSKSVSNIKIEGYSIFEQ